MLGRFPEGAICENEAAAFDPTANIYYAYLQPGGVYVEMQFLYFLGHVYFWFFFKKKNVLFCFENSWQILLEPPHTDGTEHHSYVKVHRESVASHPPIQFYADVAQF